jgi:hypothetical protein
MKHREHKCRGKMRLSLKLLQGKTSRDLSNNLHQSCVTKAMQGHLHGWQFLLDWTPSSNQEMKARVMSLWSYEIYCHSLRMQYPFSTTKKCDTERVFYFSSSFCFCRCTPVDKKIKSVLEVGRKELQDSHIYLLSPWLFNNRAKL